MKTKLLCILFSVLVITSCASKKHERPGRNVETFVTKIFSDGSKQFNFSMSMGRERGGQGRGSQRGARGGGEGRGGQGGGGREGNRGQGEPRGNSANNQQNEKTRLLDRLDMILQDNRYCREGYMELDYYSAEGTVQLRGECNEGATEEDLENFPNS